MQLFVSDLDKTLLRSDLSLGDYTKEIWNSFCRPLTIATARSYTGAKNLLRGLKLRYPMILLDGAMIADSEGNIILLNALDKETADAIIERVEKLFDERPLLVGYDEGAERFCYPKRLNVHQKELLQNYKNDKRILGIEKLRGLTHNLKIVYLGDETTLAEIEREITQNFDVESKLAKDPYQNCHFLTFLHPRGDKAHALEKLEEIMETPREAVTTFGDSHNDIGMFQRSGKAVAVANALDEVKKHADVVLEWSNDEDAVARYLAAL